MRYDAVALSKVVALLHKDRGWCAVGWDGGFPGGDPDLLVNVTDEGRLLARRGREVSAKEVRRYLWPHRTPRDPRHARAVTRGRGFVWTSYSAADDTTYIGLGARVSAETMDEIRVRVMRQRCGDLVPLFVVRTAQGAP